MANTMCPAKPAFIPSGIVLRDCHFTNCVAAEPAVSREVDRISVPSDIEAKWAALRVAGKEFRGECDKCIHQSTSRWDSCRHPLVVVPTIEPVSGELAYPDHLCSTERSTGGLCGPSGKLFEPHPPVPWLARNWGWFVVVPTLLGIASCIALVHP